MEISDRITFTSKKTKNETDVIQQQQLLDKTDIRRGNLQATTNASKPTTATTSSSTVAITEDTSKIETEYDKV